MNSWGSSTALGGCLGLLLTFFYTLSTCLSIQSTLPIGNMYKHSTDNKKYFLKVYIADFPIAEKAIY